jgi:tRNA isopentenyl-2-thiomethyl-A-37 hydroxylase MiaE
LTEHVQIMRFAEIDGGVDQEAFQQFLGGLLAVECRHVRQWWLATDADFHGAPISLRHS